MTSTTSNVVALREHTPETALAYADAVAAVRRPNVDVHRDIDAEVKRHSERMYVLTSELARNAGAPSGAPPAERRMCKKAAADKLGLTMEKLMRMIARYHLDHPDRLPLATQPGGKHSNWVIFVDRVAMVMRGEQTPVA